MWDAFSFQQSHCTLNWTMATSWSSLETTLAFTNPRMSSNIAKTSSSSLCSSKLLTRRVLVGSSDNMTSEDMVSMVPAWVLAWWEEGTKGVALRWSGVGLGAACDVLSVSEI